MDNHVIRKMCDLHKALKDLKEYGVFCLDKDGPCLFLTEFLQLFSEYEKETIKDTDGSEFDIYTANVDGTEFTAISKKRYKDE